MGGQLAKQVFAEPLPRQLVSLTLHQPASVTVPPAVQLRPGEPQAVETGSAAQGQGSDPYVTHMENLPVPGIRKNGMVLLKSSSNSSPQRMLGHSWKLLSSYCIPLSIIHV